MDNEELEPVDGDEVLDAPPVDEVEEEEQSAPLTVEDYARERGWTPKEEWKGEGEWRDAQEFLDYGLDRTKDLGRDLRDLRETTSRMAETQARIMSETVEQRLKDERAKWESLHDQAVEEGDTAAAKQAVQEITKLSVPAPQPDNGAEQFIKDNPWFNTDPLAKAVAIQTAQSYAEAGKTAQEQFEAARKEVLKRFPEYAPKTAKVIDVAKPERTSQPSNRKKGFHDLPKEAQQAAKALVARGILKDTGGYVEQYFNQEGTVG